jgi:hypothetical protein
MKSSYSADQPINWSRVTSAGRTVGPVLLKAQVAQHFARGVSLVCG